MQERQTDKPQTYKKIQIQRIDCKSLIDGQATLPSDLLTGQTDNTIDRRTGRETDK